MQTESWLRLLDLLTYRRPQGYKSKITDCYLEAR